MPKTKIFLAISILVLATLACNALSPSQGNLPRTEDDVPRVDVNTAKAAFDSGAAIIVDVRSVARYNESHVVDALSIPLNEFETNISNVELDKEQWIITYCT
jgi:3-mercaptopyruvate sulfurtransferase SseA